MKFTDLLNLSVNNLKRRKLRTFLTVLGVIIGTASIVVMLSLGIGQSEANKEMIESYGSLTTISVYSNAMYGPQDSSTEPLYLNDEAVESFRHIKHVTGASPILRYSVVAKQGIYENTYLSLQGVTREYMENIRRELGERKVDYLVVNHMEPDHSSLMSMIREAYPEARIVGNAKTVPMIKGYYGICENLHIVKEGDSISLGNSTLTFHMTPMVHWPETMMTYFHEEKTLFSGDAFGTFGALADGITDAGARLYGCSDAAADTFEAFNGEMLRYYSNPGGDEETCRSGDFQNMQYSRSGMGEEHRGSRVLL